MSTVSTSRILLLCSVLTSFSLLGFAETVSEETPPASCGSRLVAGVACTGRYCDDLELSCGPRGAYRIYDVNWSGFLSDENPAGLGCSVSYPTEDGGRGKNEPAFISGFSCRGRYCDNVALECVALVREFPGSRCEWTQWVSEETAPLKFPARYGATKMECSGSYCDKKRFYVCPIRSR